VKACGIADGDAPPPDRFRVLSLSSCLRPCSDHVVISEQRFDFVASLLRIGIVRCDLIGVSHDLLIPLNGGTIRAIEAGVRVAITETAQRTIRVKKQTG
jgi:hypothetical protein